MMTICRMMITQNLAKRTLTVPHSKCVDKATWQAYVLQSATKQRISIHLDADIIAYFKAQAGGRGYQTLINQTLRQVIANG